MSTTARNIYLDELLRVGDRVVMNMDAEARSWGRKGQADGTIGTVIGFHQYTMWEMRIHNFKKRPGKHISNGMPLVLWDDKTGGHVSSSELYFEPKWEKAMLVAIGAKQSLADVRRLDKEYSTLFKTSVWTEELPVLPFYEWDMVYIERERSSSFGDGPFKISRIDYDATNKKCDDGVTPYPIYTVDLTKEGGCTSFYRTEDLELANRGLVWHWFNDRANLVFEDLAQEAVLAHALGLVEEVRNPRTGNYGWNLDDLKDALAKNIIHSLNVSPGLFGAGPSPHGYKFTDEDLGQRIRAETMRGFNIAPETEEA